MTLANEYELQSEWRNWEFYLPELPIHTNDVVLDLGCGTGHVARLLAQRCSQVIAVDNNPELLQMAKSNNPSKHLHFIYSDLKECVNQVIPRINGIWCSFTAAYFPDFMPFLSTWSRWLKAGGWIAFVEVDNLFGHHPLCPETEAVFKAHYEHLRNQNIYDFEMGGKLHQYLTDIGLSISFHKKMPDPELSFEGPAEERILHAWRNRLERMTGLQNSLGVSQFNILKREFLDCLANPNHHCSCKVNFIIARKTNPELRSWGKLLGTEVPTRLECELGRMARKFNPAHLKPTKKAG